VTGHCQRRASVAPNACNTRGYHVESRQPIPTVVAADQHRLVVPAWKGTRDAEFRSEKAEGQWELSGVVPTKITAFLGAPHRALRRKIDGMEFDVRFSRLERMTANRRF